MDNEKLNILRLLIEHQELNLSIRQIALKRKINYKSAYGAVQKLQGEGVISAVRHGNTIICSFNRNFNASVFTVEHHRLQELTRNKNFNVLYSRFRGINQQFILLLFGSHAKKKQTTHSDIDLLLITDRPEQIEEQANLLPLPIHLTSITYADFQTMLKSTEFTVVSEAIKNNIILFGIEDYYRMIANAR
ncbi:MAG: nucleotidyltransferase domain-containing protein [Candidatus Woesearchaeota archaeon]|nr:nucleotidyltransferase domain-containing protein [Candidatus Woesearchaeota archaeon]